MSEPRSGDARVGVHSTLRVAMSHEERERLQFA